jgi:hypothetical protein
MFKNVPFFLSQIIQAEGIIAIGIGHAGDLAIGILAGRDRTYNRRTAHPVFGRQPAQAVKSQNRIRVTH